MTDYKPLIAKINDSFKSITIQQARVDCICDIMYNEGFKYLAGGLDCSVYTKDTDNYVVKVYHNTRDLRIPPKELLGSVFVNYHYCDPLRGILIQPKVKTFNESLDDAINLYYKLGWNTIDNIIDVSVENIGIDSDGKHKLLDYGCYFQVDDYRKN